jgi:hypothetical protein
VRLFSRQVVLSVMLTRLLTGPSCVGGCQPGSRGRRRARVFAFLTSAN